MVYNISERTQKESATRALKVAEIKQWRAAVSA